MKKKHPEHVNHERWLVSYADFITLLFAFFVVMYAISQADLEKFRKVSASMRAAFASSPNGTPGAPNSGGGNSFNSFDTPEARGGRAIDLPAGRTNTAGEPDPELQTMKERLEETISLEAGTADTADKLTTEYDSRGLVVRLAIRDFFAPGSAAIPEDLAPLVDRIGAVLAKGDHLIRIEGHTDPAEALALAGSNGSDRASWDLSSARAAAVASRWIKRFDVDPRRVGIAGYAHFRPLSDKDNPWGHGANRRVEWIVLNQRAGK